MKHARIAARAAAISFALLALANGADAAPLNGRWYGVGSSVNPATGPVTNSVTGFSNGAQQLMTVTWQCGQPTPCTLTGPQSEVGGQTYMIATPAGAVTPPGQAFFLAPNAECVTRYGANARLGVWLLRNGRPTVWQCLSTTRFLSISPRPAWQPIRPPVNLPRIPQQQLPPRPMP